jgi:hypothetical protein
MHAEWPQFSHDLAMPWWGFASPDTTRPLIVGASSSSSFPLEGWPAASTVEYLTKLIVLGLLLLALPYLIGKLLTRPGDVFTATAGRAMSSAIK